MFSSRKREKGSPRQRPAKYACCSGDIAPCSLQSSKRARIVMKSSFSWDSVSLPALNPVSPVQPMSLLIVHSNSLAGLKNLQWMCQNRGGTTPALGEQPDWERETPRVLQLIHSPSGRQPLPNCVT